MVKHWTRDREVPGSIPTNIKCCFLEQETLSALLSTGFYQPKKKATWKISTSLLNVLPFINKVDYYYYLSIYLSVCMSVCLSVYLSGSLSIQIRQNGINDLKEKKHKNYTERQA